MTKLIKNKKIWIFTSILIMVLFFGLKFFDYSMYQYAESASAGYPYQIGLLNSVITQCRLSCCSPAGCRCCIGGTWCQAILTEPQCLIHSNVSGTPAGGMGDSALFLNTAIAQAGLTSGGQLIAGGMSPALMDNGVLASAGGCSGCLAKNDGYFEKAKKIFQGFKIALFGE